MKLTPSNNFKDWIRVEHVIVRQKSKAGLLFNHDSSMFREDGVDIGRALDGEYEGKLIMFYPGGFRVFKYSGLAEPVCVVDPGYVACVCELDEGEEVVGYDEAKKEWDERMSHEILSNAHGAIGVPATKEQSSNIITQYV